MPPHGCVCAARAGAIHRLGRTSSLPSASKLVSDWLEFMRYPIAIEPGTDETAFGVVVPDLPGCFSAGDTLDEAITNAEEAVAGWIDASLDAGRDSIPPPSTLEHVAARREFDGWTFGFVAVDPAMMDDAVERVNITLPRRVSVAWTRLPPRWVRAAPGSSHA